MKPLKGSCAWAFLLGWACFLALLIIIQALR